MKRREFITLLGGAAAWPLTVQAQQPAMPVIGYLYAGSPESNAHLLAAFLKGLSETGYVEGQNVAIEYRWAQNDNARLPELATDLVHRRVAIIATPGSTPAALAAKAVTTTIPIVFATAGDPVELGLVESFNRPGGNATGVNHMNVELGEKLLSLLHELLPRAKHFAALVNPTNILAKPIVADLQAGAKVIGVQVEVLTASTNRDVEMAFSSLMQRRADALMVSPDPLFLAHRVQLALLAARRTMPTIYPIREYVEAGGLMSYGADFADHFRNVGIYTGRILKGEKPADLPVLRPTKFEFVINLQAAKAIDLDVPPTLLARADMVIE
jgi:putative tryptophan/tyrosine transport system substrate-binding protein